MVDKTTTLKTNTNDNVYPNVIGDNRKNAFVDSSTITHHFYDQTHKVGFQINNETNIKIQNSLQKPKGLTKTELVGVGTNGQENIKIGDNLTLANGKLSATGGEAFDIITSNDGETYTGTISGTKPILLSSYGGLSLYNATIVGNTATIDFLYKSGASFILSEMTLSNGKIESTTHEIQFQIYSHFITLTSTTLGNINFNYTSIIKEKFTIGTLIDNISGSRVICSGFINYNNTRKIAQYIDGANDKLMVCFYDLSDGSQNYIIIDDTFSISDRCTPVYN